MHNPLVSVICLCYNQASYVEESIQSVLNQTHSNIQLIVVDDASTDGSKAVIENCLTNHPSVTYLSLSQNMGNCIAFNKGLALAKGEFIVDLAADDLFFESRIEKQLKLFERLGEDYGVVYTNALYIDKNGVVLRDHSQHLKRTQGLKNMPKGDIYLDVLSKYFISAPTMLVRKKVFDGLAGYDEQLSYEDFDFWVRSARYWKYAYLDEKLTTVRKLKGSMSSKAYNRDDKQLQSTYLVCKKAAGLNRSQEENIALVNRLKYEVKQSVFSQNNVEAHLFFDLLKSFNGVSMIDKILIWLSKLNLPLSMVRKVYNSLR